MSEPFGIGGGITNAHACGCTVTADGFIDITCAKHSDFVIPPEEDEVPKPGKPQCEADGVRNGPDGPGGTEHYWTCTAPGTVDVDGTLMCEDHAGEQGYGPKQEEYGFDPTTGVRPAAAGSTGEDQQP